MGADAHSDADRVEHADYHADARPIYHDAVRQWS
jgi:hypothetical protein